MRGREGYWGNLVSWFLDVPWGSPNSEKIKAGHNVTPVECEQVFFNIPVDLSPSS